MPPRKVKEAPIEPKQTSANFTSEQLKDIAKYTIEIKAKDEEQKLRKDREKYNKVFERWLKGDVTKSKTLSTKNFQVSLTSTKIVKLLMKHEQNEELISIMEELQGSLIKLNAHIKNLLGSLDQPTKVKVIKKLTWGYPRSYETDTDSSVSSNASF